jgi:hypothetical protein
LPILRPEKNYSGRSACGEVDWERNGDYGRSLIKEMQEKHMGLLNVHGRTESPKSCLHTLLPGCWRSPPTASSMSTRYSLHMHKRHIEEDMRVETSLP